MERLTVSTSLGFEGRRWTDDVERDVRVTGCVCRLSEDELNVNIVEVDGLPEWVSVADLAPEHQEELCYALEEEFERRERNRKQLAEKLARIAASLRRCEDYAPTLPKPHDKDERIGALEFACRKAVEELAAVLKEGF